MAPRVGLPELVANWLSAIGGHWRQLVFARATRIADPVHCTHRTRNVVNANGDDLYAAV
jgi:hypothetical protein